MKRPRNRLLVLALATFAVTGSLIVASCDDDFGNGLTAAGGTGGTSSTTNAPSGSGVTGGGVGGLETDGGCTEYHCTNDLKKLVDCDGKTITDCSASDQGCAPGTEMTVAQCVADPCKAAEAAKSSYGCDYWALKTGLLSKADGACFAAFVANTWDSPVKLTVEYDGMSLPLDFAYIPKGQGNNITYEPYDKVNGLGKGEVAILFLARNQFGFVIDCPKPAAISDETGVPGTGLGKAFHIKSDRPVVAYQILPYGGGPSAFSSATLLLPSTAWDTNYIAVNAFKNGTLDVNASPLIDILANQDGTMVSILPTANIVGGNGVDPAVQNKKVTYVLNKGEFMQIEQPAELTGSVIQSDKPVALWGGESCLYIPTDKHDCDSAQQQIPPIKALGNEYVAVRYRGRAGGTDEVVPWRIVGGVQGTVLTWEPSKPDGAPDMLDQGQVVNFDSTGPFIVRSQNSEHPFYLSEYMTGGELFDSEGDPDWVNIVPPNQYLDHYVLFTDPTYSETNLVIVRKKGADGKFADVTLECLAGPVDGWTPIGKDYEYTRVDLVTGNFQDVNGCSNGRHEMSSTAPFGVTVWGWGSKAASGVGTKLVSYAYPAGASVQPINEVVLQPDPH